MNKKKRDEETKRSRWSNLSRQALSIIIAAVIALAARSSLADHYVVPTGSMLPTVEEGDRIVVDKLAYGFRLPFSQLYLTRSHEPQLGDVVVLLSPESGIVLLKRVVAGPGQTVEVRQGQLIIDGRPMEIQHSTRRILESLGEVTHEIRLTRGGGPAYGPVTIPSGQYLVMGDNRGESHDGRSFGLISRSSILGRAVACYYGDGGFQWRRL